MAKRTYFQKLANVVAYVEITNYHWDRLLGEMYNDKEMWEHLFERSNDDWWDWVDIEPVLRVQYPDSFRRFPKIDAGTEHIKTCLMKGKPLYKKDIKNANFQTFRAWMNIKDVVNDIMGTPNKEYTNKDRQEAHDKANPTPFERMFEF